MRLGIRSAAMVANANTMPPKTSVTFDEIRLRIPAGTAATNPTIPAVTPSLALASTKSASLRVSVGSIADFDTAYVLLRTMARNANGNRKNESSWNTMRNITAARSAAMVTTSRRRPPGMRSITGPMNRPSTTKGAKLTARNRITRLRASPGVIDKNKESANATAMLASPAAINA